MTDDTIGFEPIDDELRRRFRAAAPGPGDTDATLRALSPRFSRARRRHQLVVASGSLLSAVIVVFVGAIALGAGSGDRSVQVPPASRSTQRQETTTTTASPSDAPSTAGPTGAAGDGSVATPENTGTATPGATSDTGVAAPPAGIPTSSRRTFDSAGGSVTVELAGGALAIASTAPAPGYTEERHDAGPDRVEVRFRNDDGEWRVRVDVVDGEMVEEITHH